MKRRTACILKWVAIVVLALGILHAVLLGVSARSLRRAYAELEAAGRPMSTSEIIPPPLDFSDNADPLYEAAVLQLRARPSGDTTLYEELSSLAADHLADKLDAERAQRLEDLLRSEHVEAALGLVDEGARRPGYRRELDYTKGADVLLPHLSELRNLARILGARARVHAENGEREEAWRTVLAGLSVADALRTEPLLISQLVRIASFSAMAPAIHHVSALAPPDPGAIPVLQERLRSFEDVQPLLLAFDGERLVFAEWAFRLPWKQRDAILTDLETRLALRVASSSPLFRADNAAYLRNMHRHADFVARPYSPGDERFGEELAAQTPRYALLTRLIIPALSQAKERHARMIALARVTRTGLAILGHHADTGVYPASLSALDVADAPDPFGGGELRYEALPDGFLLYSIGPNFEDERGAGDDIAWEHREPGRTG